MGRERYFQTVFVDTIFIASAVYLQFFQVTFHTVSAI